LYFPFGFHPGDNQFVYRVTGDNVVDEYVPVVTGLQLPDRSYPFHYL
jgi:hypothetical protein